MSFSVGLLYSVQDFLVLASKFAIRSADFLSEERYELARSDEILDVMQECSWIRLSGHGQILLSERGVKITEIDTPVRRLRLQIEDLITVRQPPWAAKIMHGRKETIPSLPPDVRQCFSESGLLEKWNDELKEWWAQAGLLARTRHSERLSVTGRKAETLSCEYEESRTGIAPEWIALDTSYAGFDVLSCRSTADLTPLRIEVKGSERPPREADFTLTRHEFQIATTTVDYVLHLWFVAKEPQLFVVPFSEVNKHVPVDCEKGRWQQTRIPFKPFKDFRAQLT